MMVAQAGASSEAPVSLKAGYANPVWATTPAVLYPRFTALPLVTIALEEPRSCLPSVQEVHHV
ncbi:MAG: ash family protein [Symbiopectobacterium sp.]|uniref:ash family protein n=1 Tax=Symbiopectobacterium sp. TaxID=2952789 RepID=UPI0039EA1404